MSNMKRRVHLAVMTACAALAGSMSPAVLAQQPGWEVIEGYCFQCHNDEDWAGSVAFSIMDPAAIPQNAEVWEHAIRKLKGGQMPPPGAERPENNELLVSTAEWLENTIDSSVDRTPAGRIPLRRLNRREYAYAIRDLLGMEINAAALLPQDDLKHGYDNNAEALQVSPAFIDQYLNAARTIAHNAVGDRRPIPIMETYGNVADMIISLPARGQDGTGTQQRHKEGMPFGTRGGVSVTHTFLADGIYELSLIHI